MNFEEKLNEFKALDANAKKEKLLAIFEYAKDKFDFSENVIGYLNSDSSPEERVMERLYKFVVEAMITAKKRMDEEHKHQMYNVRNLSEEMKMSMQKDSEDADNLLDLINLL